MVLYRTTLVPLAEELRAADLGLLFPFYVDDTAFDGFGATYCTALKAIDEEGARPGILTRDG